MSTLAFSAPMGEGIVPPPSGTGAISRSFVLQASSINGQALPGLFTFVGTFDRRYLVTGYSVVGEFTYSNPAHSMSMNSLNIGGYGLPFSPVTLPDANAASVPGAIGYVGAGAGTGVSMGISGDNDPITGNITVTVFLVPLT